MSWACGGRAPPWRYAVGLHALQHRGRVGHRRQRRSRLSLHKRLGLVSGVFDQETIHRLDGGDDPAAPPQAAIVHTRYNATAEHPSGSAGVCRAHRGGDARPQRQPDECALAPRTGERASSRIRLGHRVLAKRRPRTGADVGSAGRPRLHRATGPTFTCSPPTRWWRARPGRLFGRWPSGGCPAGWAVASETRGARRHGRALRTRRRGGRGADDHRRRRRLIPVGQGRSAA